MPRGLARLLEQLLDADDSARLKLPTISISDLEYPEVSNEYVVIAEIDSFLRAEGRELPARFLVGLRWPGRVVGVAVCSRVFDSSGRQLLFTDRREYEIDARGVAGAGQLLNKVGELFGYVVGYVSTYARVLGYADGIVQAGFSPVLHRRFDFYGVTSLPDSFEYAGGARMGISIWSWPGRIIVTSSAELFGGEELSGILDAALVKSGVARCEADSHVVECWAPLPDASFEELYRGALAVTRALRERYEEKHTAEDAAGPRAQPS